MGCKESKHIATDNTIITRTSSTKSTNRGQDDNDKNNVQTPQRSRSGRSTMQKQESWKKINAVDSKTNNVSNKNEKSGDVKGTVDVNREFQTEGGKLKDINDQGDKELRKENDSVGVEAITKEKEGRNGNAGDNGGKESVLIPKEDFPSKSAEDGESVEAIKTDGVPGASAYSTPTEVAGAFDNTKTEKAEEKKEPVEETKDPKTGAQEAIAKENPTGNVDANSENHVREAEVDEKIKEAEAAVATPENHAREALVEEKIKEAEHAVEALEKLVKEADKVEEILVTEAKAAAANIQNPVKETEQIPVNEVEATNSSVRNPGKEANKSEEIQETEVGATDATLHNPVNNKSEENRGTETKAIDATLQNAGTESDITDQTLTKAGEAVENRVKEIHEVTGKAEEIPVKEVETSHDTDQENQALVADKAQVLEKEAEADFAAPKDPVREADNADKVKEKLLTVAEAASIAEENPVNKLESEAKVQSKDADNTEENTKSSGIAKGKISEENPDVKTNTADFVKQ